MCVPAATGNLTKVRKKATCPSLDAGQVAMELWQNHQLLIGFSCSGAVTVPAPALAFAPAHGALALALTPALAFALAAALPHACFALAVATPQPLPIGLVTTLALTNLGPALAGAFLVPALATPQAAPRRFLGSFRRGQTQRGNAGGYDENALIHDFPLSFIMCLPEAHPTLGNKSGFHMPIRRGWEKSHM